MKGFGIEIKNNLLDPKHVEAMSTAVWLYMWLIDHITSITEEGVGVVLGGKPVKFEEVKKDLGMSADTYTRWLDKLLEYPYIEAVRTPYGMSFKVFKAYKQFGKRIRKNAESNSAEVRNPLRENAESNKTITVDNNSKTGGETPAQEAREFFADYKKQEAVIAQLMEKGMHKALAAVEISKFVSYWTEKNKSGTKQKWELEPTFEIGRRLSTWFRNAGKFNKNIQQVSAIVL